MLKISHSSPSLGTLLWQLSPLSCIISFPSPLNHSHLHADMLLQPTAQEGGREGGRPPRLQALTASCSNYMTVCTPEAASQSLQATSVRYSPHRHCSPRAPARPSFHQQPSVPTHHLAHSPAALDTLPWLSGRTCLVSLPSSVTRALPFPTSQLECPRVVFSPHLFLLI